MSHEELVWNLIESPAPLKNLYLPKLSNLEGRDKFLAIIEEFENTSLPLMKKQLKGSYIHGDVNDQNLVADQDGFVVGVIDFDDSMWSYPIVELATAMMYLGSGLDVEYLLDKYNLFYKSYVSKRKVSEMEKSLLYNLCLMRFVQSTVMCHYQFTLEPDNEYLMVSHASGKSRKAVEHLLDIGQVQFYEKVFCI